MNVVILVTATLSIASAGVGLLTWLDGPGHALPAAVAITVCLLPAVATLLMVESLSKRSAKLVPAAVIVATVMRMAVAVVGVLLMGEALATRGVPRERFSGWMVFAYLLTLVLESTLLVLETGRRSTKPAGQMGAM